MGATLTSTFPEKPFKQCPMCRFVWETLADFLNDEALYCIGHQPCLDAEDLGLMMFNHSCGTTLSIEAEPSNVSFDAEARLIASEIQNISRDMNLRQLRVNPLSVRRQPR